MHDARIRLSAVREARTPAPGACKNAAMSENLALLGAYSDAMSRGDEQAVFEFWSPDFVSHVTDRVNPELAGHDIRGEEVKWWASARAAFPDMVFTVDLLIEHGDLVVSNWTVRGTHTGAPFYGVEPSGDAGRDQRHRDPAPGRRQGRRALGRSALPGRRRPHPLRRPPASGPLSPG